MKATFLYPALIPLLLLAACKQKEPPVAFEDPAEFSISGSIDNNIMQFAAGSEGYYMQADYTLDSSVYAFTGELRKKCADCKESLRITLRNSELTPAGGPVDPAVTFNDRPRYYLSATGRVNAYLVTFYSEPKGNGAVSHSWDFGDGTSSSLANPVKSFTPTGNYLVTYTSVFSGCSSSIAYPVNLSASLEGANTIGFGYTYLGGDTVLLLTDSNYSNIAWEVNGATVSTNHELRIQVANNPSKVTLKRFFAEDTIRSTKNIPPKNYLGCNANFSYTAESVNDPYNLSAVTIEWTDVNGHVYSSRNIKQRASSFRILSASGYLTNERGQRTHKLDLAFDCQLSDGQRTITLKNMRGTIAVAHP